MKKTWQVPRIQVQEFEANEYVAACYSLYCKVAGDGKGTYNKDTKFNYNVSWGNFGTIQGDWMDHGKPCALGTSYNKDKGEFYEYGKLSKASDIRIDKDVLSDGTQYATWISHDVNGSGDYTHYGFAKAVDNRPNHS